MSRSKTNKMRSGGKWMQKAVPKSHRGLLHKKLHVPMGEPIPEEKKIKAYAKAKKTGNTKLMKEINFANTVSRYSHH